MRKSGSPIETEDTANADFVACGTAAINSFPSGPNLGASSGLSDCVWVGSGRVNWPMTVSPSMKTNSEVVLDMVGEGEGGGSGEGGVQAEGDDEAAQGLGSGRGGGEGFGEAEREGSGEEEGE